MMDLDLVNSDNLESSIASDLVSGINGMNRPIKRGMLINFRNRNLPFYKNGFYKTFYSNARGVALSSETAVMPEGNLQAITETTTVNPASSPAPSNPISINFAPPQVQPSPVPTQNTTPINQTIVDQNTGLVAASSTPTSTPTQTQTQTPTSEYPTYTNGGGYMGGGGGMPVEQGGESEAASEQAKDGGVGAVGSEEEKSIFKSFWFWGLLIGAGVGYFYAKSKKKDLTKTTLLVSAIGGAVGYGAEVVVRKKLGVQGKPSMETVTEVKK